ncbi:outer membrane protein [Methylosinus sp. LW4]|uniref:outer membrane protein n=1 Tax=Methylosinus sp. LW4 TaxID=136993 RepID=UPI0012F955F0|nr:outer membrane beta-barrel protein [Methylosinus sp. LW4]
MPEPGRTTLSIIPKFIINANSLIGTKSVSSQYIAGTIPWYWNPFAATLRIVPQYQFIESQTVTLAYGFAKNFSIVLSAGVVEKHSHLMVFDGASGVTPRSMSFPGTDSLEDMTASVVWRAYQDPINRIKVNLGMSFPTGSTYNQGGAVSRTDGTYNIGRAFYGMQSGTGTFDVLPGVLYAGSIAPWSWGVSYRARLPLAVNNEGYMWGHYQEANIWGGYSWIPGLTTTVRANFNIQSPIDGKDYWMSGKLQSANPNYYGGKRIEMYGGVDIDGKLFGAPGYSVGLEGGLPVYQNLNGPQLARAWQAMAAMRWKLGEHGPAVAAPGVGVFERPIGATATPVADWSGLYLGANGGYTWAGDTETAFTYGGSGGFAALAAAGALAPNVALDSRGFIGGIQIGYNLNPSDKILAGLEADLQGLTVGNSTLSACRGSGVDSTFLQAQRNQHYLGTVRARFGYLVTPAILAFGTGGLAFGEAILNPSYFAPLHSPILNFGVGNNGLVGYVDMRSGWTAGAGLEWMPSPSWSIKTEYLRYDLGTANTANIGPLYYADKAGLSSVAWKAHINGNILRAGLNYHL